MRKLTTTVSLGAALAAVVTLVVPDVVLAEPPYREQWVDVIDEYNPDLCGLEIQIDGQETGDLIANRRGRDGLAYFAVHFDGWISFTNVANDKSYTNEYHLIDKDLKVTDDGQGNLRILILATGNETWYGPDGETLFRNPGQTRYEILVPHNGTPGDPTDDGEAEFIGIVKGSTGRNDLDGHDFCEDLNAIVG